MFKLTLHTIKLFTKNLKLKVFMLSSHLELGQNSRCSQKTKVSQNEGKKYKVKLRNAPILVLP
jgi:hypothetical protein